MSTSKGKTSTKRQSAKPKGKAVKASAKKAAAKSAIDPNRKIKGIAGQDEHFYKKFPRYAAYQLLLKAPKRTMTVKNFLAKIEALKGVRDRKQAMGIVQKLVDKKRHVGAVCASFV